MRLPYGIGEPRMFADRTEAGKELAKKLISFRDQEPVVLAIPRGGIVVAVEVAELLHAPLDVVIPRKLGAPYNPELAIGAIGGPDEIVLNEGIISELSVSREYLDGEIQRQIGEIDRRRRLYVGGRGPIDLERKTAIIVDDGLATGFTALAAIKHIRGKQPRQVILAIPVAPPETVERLSTEVDEVICLETPQMFFAVGQFYAEFQQVSDGEVVSILKEYLEGY